MSLGSNFQRNGGRCSFKRHHLSRAVLQKTEMKEIAQFIVLFFITAAYAQGSDDIDCDSTLADKCFLDVAKNLQCQTRINRNTVDCVNRTNTNSLCSAVDEALLCAVEIIDSDCRQRDGRDRFDAWIRGLRAVYYSLCRGDQAGLNEMMKNPNCWSPISFISCTERMIQVDHINDLLRTRLDMNECNRLLVGMSMCNVKAANAENPRCMPSLEIVGEVLHTFFSATECGRVCNGQPESTTSSFVLIVLSMLFGVFISKY